MCLCDAMVGNQTIRPPCWRASSTAYGLMPPTWLFSATPEKTGIGKLPTASRMAWTSTSLTMLWWCDLTKIARKPASFAALFDAVVKDAGIDVVLSGVRMPRMNSIMERWVQTCRRELLDRTLIWNQRHLLHALREFEDFYNSHRPHQGIANARPLYPLPAQVTDPNKIARLDIRRRDRLGGILHEYRHAA